MTTALFFTYSANNDPAVQLNFLNDIDMGISYKKGLMMYGKFFYNSRIILCSPAFDIIKIFSIKKLHNLINNYNAYVCTL